MESFLRSALILFLYAGAAADFSCYSCSYTYTGTTVSYECVDEPWNVTQGSPTLACAAPKQCSIDVTFEADFERILSVSRSCRDPPEETIGCATGSSRPSCQQFCNTNLCNYQNAENLRPINGALTTYCTVGYTFVLLLGVAQTLN